MLIAASIPIALLSTTAAIAMWILAIPLGRLVEWLAPTGARAYIEIFRPETTASTPE